MEKICQSCATPFEYAKPGTNADGTDNQDYCEHCYKNGGFIHPNGTMEGAIEACIPFRVPHVYSDAEAARKDMKEYFPTLKRWAKN
jgi:hypothetical protein